MKKITLLFLSLTVGTVGLFAQKTPVVATVDIQRVLNDYNAFQAAYETLKVSMAPVEEEVKRMQEDAQEILIKGRELESEIANPSISEERKSEAEAEIVEIRKQLQTAQVEIQQFRQQAQQRLQQGQKEDLEPLQEKAVEAVKAVANDKGIDIVLPLNVAVFSSDELEITDAVIAVLNASE